MRLAHFFVLLPVLLLDACPPPAPGPPPAGPVAHCIDENLNVARFLGASVRRYDTHTSTAMWGLSFERSTLKALAVPVMLAAVADRYLSQPECSGDCVTRGLHSAYAALKCPRSAGAAAPVWFDWARFCAALAPNATNRSPDDIGTPSSWFSSQTGWKLALFRHDKLGPYLFLLENDDWLPDKLPDRVYCRIELHAHADFSSECRAVPPIGPAALMPVDDACGRLAHSCGARFGRMRVLNIRVAHGRAPKVGM